MFQQTKDERGSWVTYSETGIETSATSERCISVHLAWRLKRGLGER